MEGAPGAAQASVLPSQGSSEVRARSSGFQPNCSQKAPRTEAGQAPRATCSNPMHRETFIPNTHSECSVSNSAPCPPPPAPVEEGVFRGTPEPPVLLRAALLQQRDPLGRPATA